MHRPWSPFIPHSQSDASATVSPSPSPALSTVRELDAGVSPAFSIHHLGNVGATKSERAGISKLKIDMKMVDD